MRWSLLMLIVGLVACSSYIRTPMVKYQNDDIHEVLSKSGVYDYYDSTIHLHVLLPENTRTIHSSGKNRCFVYAGNKGIAIIHGDEGYRKGFGTISIGNLEKLLSVFNDPPRLSIKKNKQHYWYAGNGIQVIMFNLNPDDFRHCVIVPMASMKISRHSDGVNSEIMLTDDIRGIF